MQTQRKIRRLTAKARGPEQSKNVMMLGWPEYEGGEIGLGGSGRGG